MKLRFLIVGLGSMGKRRVRNLLALGERDIVGFDINPRRAEEAKTKYSIKTVDNFQDARPEDFDVMIISTAPEAHGEYIRYALAHKKHFFVEHPVNDDGYKDIFKFQDNETVKAPSCTFRFYPPIRMIKEQLDKGVVGKVLAFQYHMGQYLPDWHPWENYRDVYFSKKDTGACREMLPFELIWLNWLMGSSVQSIAGFTAKVSDLDIAADDIFLADVKYKNGIFGSLLIDVISRKPFRTLRILGADGVLDWERFDHSIKIYKSQTGQAEIIDVPKGHPETGYVNEEEMYNDEIKAFLAAIQEKIPYPHTFADNLQLLKTMFALEKSSHSGERINL